MRSRLITICLSGLALLSVGISYGQQVVVTPGETDEILANPGMGWETFHRTSNQDKSLPSWIPSTVHYARWGWGTLEPARGKIDDDFLGKVLKETRESGQKLAFRVMCCSTYPGRPYHPGSMDLFTEEFFREPKDLPPGQVHEVADTFSLPGDMPLGEYIVSVGVVGLETERPVVRLGIQGRAEDGWYPVSKVRIER